MHGGPEQDVAAIGDAARATAHRRALPIPLLAVQGGSDPVVSPRHAAALVRQYLHLNGHASTRTPVQLCRACPRPTANRRQRLASGRTETVREWRSDGRLVARLVEVSGLGHAWSGGDADAGLQRRGSARRDGARRRVLCRCTILTRFRDEEPKGHGHFGNEPFHGAYRRRTTHRSLLLQPAGVERRRADPILDFPAPGFMRETPRSFTSSAARRASN
jgi:hypothetical protein